MKRSTSAYFVTIAQGIHFDQISIKISVLGSYTLIVAPMGVKFGVEGAARNAAGNKMKFIYYS